MAEETANTATLGSLGNYDSDIFQKRLAEIRTMPPGPEKDKALRDLTQDYEGLAQIYSQDILDAAKISDVDSPKGVQAGNIYVAPSMAQGLSSALRYGIGQYRQKQARDKLMELSEAKTRGTMGLGAAGASEEQQQAAQQAQPQFQTQAQKPDYRQYGYGDPVVRAGMAQMQGRDVPQHVQNSADRRAKAAAAGVELPVPGTGPAGQLKRAAGITPRSEALRAMGGMGKPDLSRYGAPDIDAGWGQQTPRPRQESRTVSGDETRRLMGEELAGKMAANTGGEGLLFGAGVRPDQLTEQQQSLFDLINRRNRRF